MYKIKIITPGKTKAKFIKDGISHYIKIISPYAKVEIIELREGSGERDRVIEQESKAILSLVKEDFVILHKDGQILSSEEFADFLRDKAFHQFVIGGVFGVNQEVFKSASFKLSLSRMTFPHELTRVILLEQLYRAMTIIHGKSYHY